MSFPEATGEPRYSRTIKVTLDTYLPLRQAASDAHLTVMDLVSGCMASILPRMPALWALAEQRGMCPYDLISAALDGALQEKPPNPC